MRRTGRHNASCLPTRRGERPQRSEVVRSVAKFFQQFANELSRQPIPPKIMAGRAEGRKPEVLVECEFVVRVAARIAAFHSDVHYLRTSAVSRRCASQGVTATTSFGSSACSVARAAGRRASSGRRSRPTALRGRSTPCEGLGRTDACDRDEGFAVAHWTSADHEVEFRRREPALRQQHLDRCF